MEAVFLPLLSDRYLAARYEGKSTIVEVAFAAGRRVGQMLRTRSVDLLWIEKELLPYCPAAIEDCFVAGRPYVLDFDDAIFHNYDLSDRMLVRRALGKKIDHLTAKARLVTVGNDYLRARAVQAGAGRVERLPSVVDLDRYPLDRASFDAEPRSSCLVVIWIGSPATVHYLDLVRTPLQKLASRMPIELRVVGAPAPTWLGVRSLTVKWSEETEAAQLAAADLGIMPLHDGPWERGKCGYKLIQYMACGLPVIASPVGVNAEIVANGIDGFLAATDDQWEQSLDRLAASSGLRRDMGRSGRKKVERAYCVQAIAPRFAALLREAVG